MDEEMKTTDHRLTGLTYRYLLIVAAVLAAYAGTLSHGFVWDDFDIIVQNPTLQLKNIPLFFVTEDKISGPTGYYRPVTYISFAIDRAVWGTNPLGFNITNLLLHVLVGLLFYRVVAALFRRENLALTAALLFALHPVAAETVNFHAGGRNTLLCAFFTLASLLFYTRKKDKLAVACFTLGIFSKEFALLLPAIFLLYDKTINDEKGRVGRYVPYAVAAGIYLLMRSAVVKANANLIKAAHISDNIWIVPQTLMTYLRNMLLPFYLKTLYYVNLQTTWRGFFACSAGVLLLVVLAVVFRKRREVLFGITMFLLFLLPVTNIFNLGAAMVADRYAYLASLGFSLVVAYLVCLAPRKASIGVTAVLCVVFVVTDVSRSAAWKDEISLFRQMADDAPELSTGYQNLGVIHYNRGEYAEAEKYMLLAMKKEGITDTVMDGFTNMFVEMEKPDVAAAVLARKMENDPKNPEPYLVLARVREAMGNPQQAASDRAQAEALAPGVGAAMRKRLEDACREGEELMSRGRLSRAEDLFDTALTIDPYSVAAAIGMGSVKAAEGDFAKAEKHFRRAAKLAPLNPAPHYNLSLLYSSIGKMKESEVEMVRFRELSRFVQTD